MEMMFVVYVTFATCGIIVLLNSPNCLQVFLRNSSTDTSEEFSKT